MELIFILWACVFAGMMVIATEVILWQSDRRDRFNRSATLRRQENVRLRAKALKAIKKARDKTRAKKPKQ